MVQRSDAGSSRRGAQLLIEAAGGNLGTGPRDRRERDPKAVLRSGRLQAAGVSKRTRVTKLSSRMSLKMTAVNIEIALVGLVVGTIVGLTGVGGASIMTPLLILVLGINPLVAVGTDLLYSVPTKLYGAFLHNKQGTVKPEIVKALLLGGLPASLVGLAILFWLRHHVDVKAVELWTRHAIGFVLFIAAAVVIIQPFIRRRAVPMTSENFEWRPGERARVIAIGAVVGVIVTATSIGSGSVTLPLLALTLPLVGLSQLVGSDIAFAAFLIPAAALGRWSMGDVNLSLVFTLLLGSLPGVYIGSKLCGRMSQKWLRPAVALTLAFVGTRLI